MNSKCFLLLAFAFLGASAAPLIGTSAVGVGSVHGSLTVGPTVSETVVTPFHRTDAVATPCGRSVVHTAAAPVVSYGVTGGSGFLGTGAGLYHGIGGGFGTGAFHSGLAGTGGHLFTGITAGGLGVGGFGGLGGAGIGGFGGIHGAAVGI